MHPTHSSISYLSNNNPHPRKLPPQTNAVVLLSGGLDSTTVLSIAQRDGFTVNALSFSYGQRHSAEVDAAKRIARAAGVARHEVAVIDLRAFGGSALTAEIAVPKNRDLDAKDANDEIPVTYVPARNTIFLSYALGFAEVTGSSNIYIGVNALDYSGYPDCRPEYIRTFEEMANLATKSAVQDGLKVRICAPLINLSKADIIKLGTSLGVDYSLTTSCYDPDSSGAACGECDACQLRLRGFAEAGLRDPVRYANHAEGR